MNRLLSRLGPSRSSKKQSFKQWSDSATADDVHALFTKLIKSGTDEGQAAAFSAERLAILERVLSVADADAADEAVIENVQGRLKESLPSLTKELEAASSILSLLLRSHASFPFAQEVPLTRDAMIRSIGLITRGSDYMFSQSAKFGGEPTIRTRSKTSRMHFLFSALAHPEPPTGVPVKDDVLDVLCRIRYPHPASFTKQQRRAIAELEPLAQRLLPASPNLPSRDSLCVPLGMLRPLADLCNAMREDKGVGAEKLLASKENLDWNEFKQWAKAVSLPIILDRVFGVLTMSTQR